MVMNARNPNQANAMVDTLFYSLSRVDSQHDEIEEKYKAGLNEYRTIRANRDRNEIIKLLTNAVNSAKENAEKIYRGMLADILTEPTTSLEVLEDLSMINNDGYQTVCELIRVLVIEKYLRLREVTRTQTIWLVGMLVHRNVTTADLPLGALLRCAAGGDLSHKNLSLIDKLIDIFQQDNRRWLNERPMLISTVVYSYLRFLEDHTHSSIEKLKLKEVRFVVALIKENFQICIRIGRDFLRLLQNVSAIPEIRELFKDIMNKPSNLDTNFTGVQQLMKLRTSRKLFQCRLTPDMETKIVFMTTNVKMAQSSRYKDWFQRKYLNNTESQTLKSDLIRFIIHVITPTNDHINSEITQRWNLIAWLLQIGSNQAANANAKLALFYDWLAIDQHNGDTGNIMNVEPALLIVGHTLHHNGSTFKPKLGIELLDFLCKLVNNFHPPMAEDIRRTVIGCFHWLKDKNVIDVVGLFSNPKIGEDVRKFIHSTFPSYFNAMGNNLPPIEKYNCQKISFAERNSKFTPKHKPLQNAIIIEDKCNNDTNNHSADEATFSDDDVEFVSTTETENKVEEREPMAIHISDNDSNSNDSKESEPDAVAQLEDSEENAQLLDAINGLANRTTVRDSVIKMGKEIKRENLRELMDNLVKAIMRDGERMEKEEFTHLSNVLDIFLKDELDKVIFPDEKQQQKLTDCIDRPFFEIVKGLYASSGAKRSTFFSILTKLRVKRPQVGYFFLFFTIIIEHYKDDIKLQETISRSMRTNKNTNVNVYKSFFNHLDDSGLNSLEECLLRDLEICQENDTILFCWLIPTLYKEYHKALYNNTKFIELVVTAMSSKLLNEFICNAMEEKLIMFDEGAFTKLSLASLTWTTSGQYCFWQLAKAHSISLEKMLETLPKLDFYVHTEAVSNILVMLHQQEPTVELLATIFTKPRTDPLVRIILNSWYNYDCDILASAVYTLLNEKCPSPTSPGKRKRGQQPAAGQGLNSRTGVPPPTAEKIIEHLITVRDSCKNMFKTKSMQRVLKKAKVASSETQKQLYAELFSLVEDDEDTVSNPSGNSAAAGKTATLGKTRSKKGAAAAPVANTTTNNSNSGSSTRRNAASRANLKDLSDSSDSISDMEEEVRSTRNSTKRRKVAQPAASDSDD